MDKKVSPPTLLGAPLLRSFEEVQEYIKSLPPTPLTYIPDKYYNDTVKEEIPVVQLDAEGENGLLRVALVKHVDNDIHTLKSIFKRTYFETPIYKSLVVKESDTCIRFYFTFYGEKEIEKLDEFLGNFLPALDDVHKHGLGSDYLRLQLRTNAMFGDYIDSGELLPSIDNITISERHRIIIFTGIRPETIRDISDANGKYMPNEDGSPFTYVFARGTDEVRLQYNRVLPNVGEKKRIIKIYGNEDIAKDAASRDEKIMWHKRTALSNEDFYDYKKEYAFGVVTDCKKALDDAIAELPEGDRKIINKNLVEVRDATDINSTVRTHLDKMVGLDSVKKEVAKIQRRALYDKIQKQRGILDTEPPIMHMCFTGNPGTGKTTIARYIAQILSDAQYIKKPVCFEVNAQLLKGGYAGQTATIVRTILKAAKGCVLFIDEAYALCDEYNNGYGQEAISVLMKEMEDNKNDVVIIFAGYKKEMEKFLQVNEGLKSRINKYIDFPDYSPDELLGVFSKFMRTEYLSITDEAIIKAYAIFKKACTLNNFSNARFVRNFFEKVSAEHTYNFYKLVGERAPREQQDAYQFTIHEQDITDKIEYELLSMSK